MDEHFILVHPKPIEITPEDAGVIFVGSDAANQRRFLLAMAADIALWEKGQSWAVQCRNIVDLMPADERAEVASIIGTLAEHLNEPGGKQ